MIKWFLSWIDNYFQTESSRRQKARQYLAAAGVKEGQIDALMKTIVPLSSIYGFDVLECCNVLSQVSMIGKLLPGEYRQLMNMNFPIHIIMFIGPLVHTFQHRVSTGMLSWETFAAAICLYYDELQKN